MDDHNYYSPKSGAEITEIFTATPLQKTDGTDVYLDIDDCSLQTKEKSKVKYNSNNMC